MDIDTELVYVYVVTCKGGGREERSGVCECVLEQRLVSELSEM